MFSFKLSGIFLPGGQNFQIADKIPFGNSPFIYSTKNMDKIRFIRETSQAAGEAAAGEILNRLLEQNKNNPVLLLLAGGSALKVLDYIGAAAMGGSLTITASDDRFSEDAAANNFLQLQKTDFYALAQGADANFFGTLPRPGEKMEEMAKRWEYNLRTWRQENPRGKIFALLGMGADGHIAGMFPYPEDEDKFHRLFENEDWVAAYDALGKHKYNLRVTITSTFFKFMDEAVLFACGWEKQNKLRELEEGKSSPNELPAAALYAAKNATAVTDQE